MSILNNISNLVKQLMPIDLRENGTKYKALNDYIQATAKPLQDNLDEHLALELNLQYLAGIRFETIYLDMFLNDQLDNALRRIYIETNQGALQTWMFQRVEQRNAGHAFKRWSSAVAYLAGDTVHYKGRLYEAALGSTNQNPFDNAVYWTDIGPTDKIFQRLEYTAEYSFTVWLPTTFDVAVTYNIGDIVFKDDVIYLAKVNGILGAWTASEWSVYDEHVRNELDRFRPAGNNYNFKTF